jgi:hypothetical protein
MGANALDLFSISVSTQGDRSVLKVAQAGFHMISRKILYVLLLALIPFSGRRRTITTNQVLPACCL